MGMSFSLVEGEDTLQLKYLLHCFFHYSFSSYIWGKQTKKEKNLRKINHESSKDVL